MPRPKGSKNKEKVRAAPSGSVVNKDYILELMKQYRDMDRRMDSPWCNATWRMKEGYGELGRLKREIYSLLDELEGKTNENSNIL